MAVSSVEFFNHIDSFMQYRKEIHEISKQTIKSNNIDLKLFFDFVKEHNYQEINGPVVIDFQFYLKKQRQNCGASINRKIFTLKSYAKFLQLDQIHLAQQLPFRHVLKIRQGYLNRPGALNRKQLLSFFNTIDRSTFQGIRDYAAYALMYDLGLRVGEVHNLNIENIDVKNKKLTVMGKGNKPRTLYLNPEILKILSEWLAVRHHFKNYHITHALFISKKGLRLAIRTLQDNLKKILTKLDFNTHFNVTCHTFRHSFASHLNDKEVDILVIQSLLGHATPKSTETYIHPYEYKVREAMEKLSGILYLKQLINTGAVNLNFQTRYCSKKE